MWKHLMTHTICWAPRMLTALTNKLMYKQQSNTQTQQTQQTIHNMQTSETGLKLIAQFEGCKLVAYKCPAGVWTIGYGHTGKDVKPGMAITEDKAFELLGQDIVKTETVVNRLLSSQINVGNITQGMFDALVSFAYNCGTGNLQKSTLLKKVLANSQDSSIVNEFAMWNKAGGRVLPGLVKRRKAEAELYFN